MKKSMVLLISSIAAITATWIALNAYSSVRGVRSHKVCQVVISYEIVNGSVVAAYDWESNQSEPYTCQGKDTGANNEVTIVVTGSS